MGRVVNGPKPRAHWHDAYDAQLALTRWYRTPGGYEWMAESCRANLRSGGKLLPEYTRDMIIRLYDAEMGRLPDCDPIFVSEGMCEVVDHARQSFQPEPLLETDLLTPRAFLYFATPLHMADRHGVDIALKAASWSWEYEAKDADTATRILAEITKPDRFAKYGTRIDPSEMREFIDAGDIWPAGVSVTLYAEREHYMAIGQERRDDYEDALRWTKGIPVVPFHITPWHFGQSFDGNEVDLNNEVTGAEGWWTTLQTAFRLMQQRVSPHSIQRASRTQRREAAKRGAQEPKVVVIRLRREEHPSHEHHETNGEGRKLKHRHYRTGHWRNQPYKSLGVTRQIWIDPTVVGDPSLPMMRTPRRVYQWSR